MSCGAIREQLHSFIDGRLSGVEGSRVEAHLSQCDTCRAACEDFTLMREVLAVRHSVPVAARQQMMRQLERSRRRGIGALINQVWEGVYTFWRDLDRPVLWSKVSAIPVTASFFVVLLFQFSTPTQNLLVPVFTVGSESAGVHNVRVSPTSEQMQVLVDAAWRLPYEDSLSLVAQISPDGKVEINEILEHPKSFDLLKAVDLTLRSSRTRDDEDNSKAPRYAIFSLQKIDVYEGL